MSVRKDVRELLRESEYYNVEISPEQFGLDSVEALRKALRETKDTGCVPLDCSRAGREPDVTLCRCGSCGATLARIQKDPASPLTPQRFFFGLDGFVSNTAWAFDHHRCYRTLYIILYLTPYEGEHFISTSKAERERAVREHPIRVAAKAGYGEDEGMRAQRIMSDRVRRHIFTSSIGRDQGPLPPHTEFEAPIVEIKCPRPRCGWLNYQDLAELA